jgi:HEPN domain-containing protein
MKGPADLAARLARKASNDLAAARIGLDHGAPLDTVSFHLQQAAEKLLKAALAAKDLDYPFNSRLA